ncbi:MAG: class I SAM-dependent methyltransferase, partial [Alphaproteobacteria bacterium]|nr:class I SAM-dependent methyltransferase [Alphaproteobacteria bacterium]
MPFLIFAGLLYTLAVALFGYMIFSFFYFRGWNNPPYIPSFGKSKKTVVTEVFKLLSGAKNPLNIADLGCGDGSLLAGLSPKFPQHKFFGYEWDPLPFNIAKRRLKKYKNTHIIRADLMKINLKHLDIVLCY